MLSGKKGVFIVKAEDLIEEQKDWHEKDLAKNIDFSTYKFWVVTDDGFEPVGYDTILEAITAIDKGELC